jgi:hypothetical protein
VPPANCRRTYHTYHTFVMDSSQKSQDTATSAQCGICAEALSGTPRLTLTPSGELIFRSPCIFDWIKSHRMFLGQDAQTLAAAFSPARKRENQPKCQVGTIIYMIVPRLGVKEPSPLSKGTIFALGEGGLAGCTIQGQFVVISRTTLCTQCMHHRIVVTRNWWMP